MVQQVDPSKATSQCHTPESSISRPSQETLPRVREQLPDLNRDASLSDRSIVSTSSSPLPFKRLLTRSPNSESVSQIRQNILNRSYVYTNLECTSEIWSMQIAGDHLVIGSSESRYGDGAVRVWDVNTLKFLGELKGHTHQVRCLEVHNGKIYTGSLDHTCRIWDVNTKECLGVLNHDHSITSMKVVNEKWMVTGLSNGICKVWDLNTLECLHTLEGHPHSIHTLDANENSIVSVSFEVGTCKNHCVIVWDMHSGKLLSKIEGQGSMSCVKVLQNEFITAGSSYNHTCQVWDLKTGVCKKTLRPQIDGALNCMEVIGPLVVLAGAGQWMIWDRDTDKVIISEKQEEHVISSMEIVDDLVFTGSYWNNVLKVWDFKTGKCLQTLIGYDCKPMGKDHISLDGIRCFAYQDGKLVSGSGQNRVCIRDFKGRSDKIPQETTVISTKLLPSTNEHNVRSLKNLLEGLTQGQRGAKIEYADVEGLPSLLSTFSELSIEMKRGVSSHFFQQICVARFSPKERDLQWAEKVFLDPSLNDPQINHHRASAILGYLREKNLDA